MEPTTPMIEIEAARMASAYRALALQMVANRDPIEAAQMCRMRATPAALMLREPDPARIARRFDLELSAVETKASLFEAGIGGAWVTLDDAGQMLRIESGQVLLALLERGFPNPKAAA